jgi:hypothetical protein
MKMKRKAIPKKIKEIILKEYRHKCAICAGDGPQMHHIDEDPENNDINNIIPLCPNCHLRDQHDPTAGIDTGRLKLFRKYKDPAILCSQFYPLYRRFKFIYNIDATKDYKELYLQASDLIEFVGVLNFGSYYSGQIYKLCSSHLMAMIEHLKEPSVVLYGNMDTETSNIIDKIKNNIEAIESMLIELIRYQNWKYEPR